MPAYCLGRRCTCSSTRFWSALPTAPRDGGCGARIMNCAGESTPSKAACRPRHMHKIKVSHSHHVRWRWHRRALKRGETYTAAAACLPGAAAPQVERAAAQARSLASSASLLARGGSKCHTLLAQLAQHAAHTKKVLTRLTTTCYMHTCSR